MILTFGNREDERIGMRDSYVTRERCIQAVVLINHFMIPLTIERVVMFLYPGSFLLIGTHTRAKF